MLTDTFLKLISRYNPDKALANDLWLEIFTRYSEPKRHYHTIDHLEQIMAELDRVRPEISNWEAVLFAVYYHDIIYKPTSSTNEEESARLATERLNEVGVHPDVVKKCSELILATKQHQFSPCTDINYLNDADLAILGQAPYEFQNYAEAVREEFGIYPDFIYNSTRKKILQHFLEMKKIYKTDYFFQRYEKQARINLANELQDLNS